MPTASVAVCTADFDFYKGKDMTERIIWDFNGTILDDVDTGIVSVNKLLADRGLPLIESREQYQQVFRFPIKGYYERIGFDFSVEPYEVIAPLWVEQYMINVQRAGMFCDVTEALEYFKSRGIKQTVISATEENMLRGQLRGLGIAEYFDEVLGLDNIHAGSKVGIALEWRSKHRDESAIFIGDTDHDAEVARAIDALPMLVCRGHQSREYLAELGVSIYDDLTSLIADNFRK